MVAGDRKRLSSSIEHDRGTWYLRRHPRRAYMVTTAIRFASVLNHYLIQNGPPRTIAIPHASQIAKIQEVTVRGILLAQEPVRRVEFQNGKPTISVCRLLSSRDHINPHSRTFSITHRVRRVTGFLQTALSKVLGSLYSAFHLYMSRLALPMNASCY
jgi:hypothetical protein